MNNLISSYCCCDDGGGPVVDCLGLIGGELGRSCDWFPSAWDISVNGGFKTYKTAITQGGQFGTKDCNNNGYDGGLRLYCEEIDIEWQVSGRAYATTHSSFPINSLSDYTCPTQTPDHCQIMSNPSQVAYYRSLCGDDGHTLTCQITGTRTWNQILDWNNSACGCIPAGSYTNSFSATMEMSATIFCFGSPPRMGMRLWSPNIVIPVSGVPSNWPCQNVGLLSSNVSVPSDACGIFDANLSALSTTVISQELSLADAGQTLIMDAPDWYNGTGFYLYDCPIGCPDPLWPSTTNWPGFHGCVTRTNATIVPVAA